MTQTSGRHTASNSSRRCKHCGGLNAADAAWCGQCLTRFAAPPPPPPVSRPPEVEASSQPPIPQPGGRPASLEEAVMAVARSRRANRLTASVRRGAFTVAGEQITWDCKRCGSSNDLEQMICSTCGAPFADTVKDETGPQRPARDPAKAALLSLLLPGAGHAYVGVWGQAIARAIISSWVVLVALFAALAKGPASVGIVVSFGLASLGLWAVSAYDAYQEASQQPGAAILRGRHFLYLTLGLLSLLVVLVFFGALKAQG